LTAYFCFIGQRSAGWKTRAFRRNLDRSSTILLAGFSFEKSEIWKPRCTGGLFCIQKLPGPLALDNALLQSAAEDKVNAMTLGMLYGSR
jgi:hypothetical protein